MDRIQFITYKSKKILLEDFSNTRPGTEFHENIKKAQAMIASQPPKSVLALFDATGATFNNDALSTIKEFTKANTPFIKAACVIGISGLLQVALTAASKFSGRDFVMFKTREEGLEWLFNR